MRLLLSCLHAWNLDDSLDKSCEEFLGLIRPSRPVSFGFYCKSSLSLVLPGWGLKSRPKLDSQMSTILDLNGSERTRAESFGDTVNNINPSTTPIDRGMMYPPSVPDGGEVRTASPQGVLRRANSIGFTFDQKYHIRWQFSRSLTTQHLLTMVSLTNTLMNQSVGAHALASSARKKNVSESSMDEDSDSDSEESLTTKDNQIRAVWSQVAALHCVMLPERMQGKFRAPHLPVLAARFLDPCQAVSGRGLLHLK